jgi:hypothetical protein
MHSIKRRYLAMVLGVALVALPVSMASAIPPDGDGRDDSSVPQGQSGETPETHGRISDDSPEITPTPDSDNNYDDDGYGDGDGNPNYVPCSQYDPCSPNDA